MASPSPVNPYSAPGAASSHQNEFQGADRADLFVEMQPTMQVRAAGLSAILTGVAFLFVTLQFSLFAISARLIVLVLECSAATLGASFILVAWGMASARGWSAVLGLVISVLGGTLVAIAFFLSGAFSCVLAGAAALVTLVLIGVGFGDLRKMARARAAMARLDA